MSNRNDRSDAALRERLKLAEKAVQEVGTTLWKDYQTAPRELCILDAFNERILTMEDYTEVATARHIAASSPDVVRADIEEILRLRAEVERLNKVSHYLAERLSPLNVTRRKYIGATLGDGYGNALFLTREEAIRSWLDEANREVSNAE